MAQVFISYAHVSPDQDLAKEISSLLERNGYTVFADTKIRLGQNWAEQIDLQLRQAEYFIVLLSAASVKSDMVRREIALAHRLRKAKQLTILPVRLGLQDDLPYDIGAYLDLIQHTIWNPDRPLEPLAQVILEAMRGQEQQKAQEAMSTQAGDDRAGSAEMAQAAMAAASAGSRTASPAASGCRDAVRPGKFDRAQLDCIRRELAFYIGPMAGVILDQTSKQAADLRQLCELLACEIPNGTERKKFLARFLPPI